MRDKYLDLKDMIKGARTQLGALATFSQDYLMKHSTIGVGKNVMFDINVMFSRYEYHVNRMLYHSDKFIELVENYKYQSDKTLTTDESVFTNWNDDRLYYEFDSFIASSASLFEDPFRLDAQKCFSKKIYKNFDKLFPTKSNSDSLIWRLTIIRNRTVHPDHPTYSSDGNRFIEFSSKAGNMVEIKNGFPIRITGNLIDIEYNREMKLFLDDYLIPKTKEIKKEFKGRDCSVKCSPKLPDFHSLIFNQTNAVNKSPSMVVSTSKMNLIESFASILKSMIEYLSSMNSLFYSSYKDHLLEDFQSNRIFFITEEGCVNGWGIKSKGAEQNNFIKQEELFM